MVATPAPMPSATPSELTVATLVFDDAHVAPRIATTLSLTVYPVTVNGCVDPDPIDAVTGVTRM
jgi:hypothetical protein